MVMMIGILALQGNVLEHRENLGRHGVQSRCIRIPGDLDGIDGLILPGGESTTMRLLIASSGLKDPVMSLIREGLPVWGTCAGVILLAQGGPWQSLDVQVERNAYGPQLYSRVAKGMSAVSDRESSMVFIRAPRIRPLGDVEILAQLDGDVVAARQHNILFTTFHPELSDSSPFTEYFLNMVRQSKSKADMNRGVA
jgi:pyridoxal 5'-phosphate synthase pdxT subunit